MKIAVVGAGGMGGVFGGTLVSAGHDVWLVDVWKDHVRAINEHGLVIESPEGSQLVHPHATTDAAEVSNGDMAIVFVKAYQTAEAAPAVAAALAPEGIAITFQNGLGNGEKLAAALGPERVLAGVTLYGATLLGPGRVALRGAGPNHLGRLDGQITAEARRAAETLSAAGLPTSVADNVAAMIWSKLVLNAGVNALSALCRVKNADLAANGAAMAVSAAAVTEAVEVAKAKGIAVLWDDPVTACRDMLLSTPENKPSMLMDVLAERRTEIGAINGAIAEEGQAVGVATPVNEVLAQLISALERGYDRRIVAT